MIDIYNLIWTDKYGAYGVCPDCHGVAYLMSEDENGNGQEWLCDDCWHVHDENGRYISKWHQHGLDRQTCPECGDFRIDKDPEDSAYYCRNCKSVFRRPQGETVRDANGQAIDWRLIDLGPVEHPEICPNCGDPLRRQLIEAVGGNYWAYPCRQCGVQYRFDGALVRPEHCPKCGKFGVGHSKKIHIDRTVKPAVTVEDWYKSCRFCGTEFDTSGDYLHDADRPTHGNRQIPQSILGMISANPNNAKPQ